MVDDPRPDFVPDWPTCTADKFCRGVQVYEASCLFHRDDKVSFLNGLRPGADLDLRGTTVTGEMFQQIVERFREEEGVFHYGKVSFSRVWFTEDTDFGTAIFTDEARFDGACFSGSALFSSGSFRGSADFRSALFTAADLKISVTDVTDFSLAQFAERAVLEIEGAEIGMSEARFMKGVTLRLRGGALDATGMVFGEPATIIGHEDGRCPAEVVSLRGVDVRGLVLVDVSLRGCVFAGAHGLDQLRVEGHCPFERHRGKWLTRRQMLVEELAWRDGWDIPPSDEPVGPARLAGLYRLMRKSFEDSKNEAGAGDFYYGEMEMRRHSPETSRAEKTILWSYWLLSGYGQRASRAVAALAVLVIAVATLLILWGQPFGHAARIAVGAVVFRDDRTDLTEAGEWTVIIARFLGPVLLALAVLAVRARVKR